MEIALQSAASQWHDAEEELRAAEVALERCEKKAAEEAAKRPPPEELDPNTWIPGGKDHVDTVADGYTEFKIRYIGGIDGGEVVAIGFFTVEIRDSAGHSAIYSFWGAGGGIGLPAGVTGPGSWSRFRTSEPMDVFEFEGLGGITTSGGAAGPALGQSLIVFGCWDHPTQVVPAAGLGTGIHFSTSSIWGWWELND